MTDLVSIIMPVYNGEKYIADAIRSVFNQEYLFWELIIVNDGSTDDTEKRILEFSDHRIKYFVQSNKGASAARNSGIRKMKGQYLCCLDSDDLLPPNSILSRLKIFKDNRDSKFVDGLVKVYDSTLSEVLDNWRPSFVGMPFHQLVRLNGRCFFGPTWMIKVDENYTPSFDEDLFYAEDLLFYISMARQGNYNYTDDCILYYRRNPTSAMANLDGLARGYTYLCSKIKSDYYSETTMIDRFLVQARSRKIMFLTFWDDNHYIKALKYLVLGHL